MLSMIQKALQLEGLEENGSASYRCLVESKSLINSSNTKEQIKRPISPISRFRFIDEDADDENTYNCDDWIDGYTEVVSYDPRTGDLSDPMVERRDEDDEEHNPLSYFFRPTDKSGTLLDKLEREIAAAKKVASISVTSDISYKDAWKKNCSKESQQSFILILEELKGPKARLSLKPVKELNRSDIVRSRNNTRSLSDLQSLFGLCQFVVEHDDIGEGVSVQASLSIYEDERRGDLSPPFRDFRAKETLEHYKTNSSLCDGNGLKFDSSVVASDCVTGQLVSKLALGSEKVHLQVSSSADGNSTKFPKNIDEEIQDCLSATESDVDSVNGLPRSLQSKWLMGESPKEQMLASLDGLQTLTKQHPIAFDLHDMISVSPISEAVKEAYSVDPPFQNENSEEPKTIYDIWPFNMFCGKDNDNAECVVGSQQCKTHNDVPLALLDCANIIYQEDRIPVTAPAVPTSVVRLATELAPLSYAETLRAVQVDPRMQDWISSQFKLPGKPPKDGTYQLGKSRTVIVHEIARGAWTWCTEWSPDGNLLAVATENHHIAVVDITMSTVWRVRHDRRISGPPKNHTTHSIRAISWGQNFIAIGGTGNAVSILEPTEPYAVVHTITATGFVGTLDWREKSNILAFGSRLDKVTIAQIVSTDEDSDINRGKQVESQILHTIELKYWANSVKFCAGGNFLAVGDAGGVVSVYSFSKLPDGLYDVNAVAWFPRKDSILCVEWSPDSKWLYAGGEDRCITVIDCTFWEIVHKKNRERWVQCIASSHGGSHLAVGGVSSEISLLDTNNGWDSVMGVELKGLVPLSANWHPKDQYLALTGQNNSILVVETTNARHVKGHHLYSISPILAIEFSPDGRMAIIGNQAGVVTFFALSGTTFITAYELIITLNTSICMRWSLNGTFAIIGGKDALIIVGRKKKKRQSKKAPPNLSQFSIRKVIREFGETNAVSIDHRSQYVAVSGSSTRILDAHADFVKIREWDNGPYYANAWSPDGRWFAMIGEAKLLTIYDTSEQRIDRWRPIFSMKCDFVGLSLAWLPSIVGGLLYLAYGGTSNEIFIVEIRTREGTWETVLRIPRDGNINSLDWGIDGLLAAAIGNGTVGIIDLGYLQSGLAVNEMDYNWQRQALTCFTEIRRNRGRNSMSSIRWLPAAPGSDRLLAVGGTDGELEILDLTERQRCRGYVRGI